MKTLLLTLTILLAIPATAGATIIDSDRPEYQQWTNEALVPVPRGTITVHDSECRIGPHVTAACQQGRVIYSVIRGGPSLFLHELGHAFDEYEMERIDRLNYARHYEEPLNWRAGIYPLSERFAEDYRACARGTCPDEIRSIIDQAWRDTDSELWTTIRSLQSRVTSLERTIDRLRTRLAQRRKG